MKRAGASAEPGAVAAVGGGGGRWPEVGGHGDCGGR